MIDWMEVEGSVRLFQHLVKFEFVTVQLSLYQVHNI